MNYNTGMAQIYSMNIGSKVKAILYKNPDFTGKIGTFENNVDDSKWNLVTGDKKQIYELARKSYLAVEDSSFNEFDMIHTENFMLIDKEKQIRGFYDGTNSEEINRLLKDIEILKQSYNK